MSKSSRKARNVAVCYEVLRSNAVSSHDRELAAINGIDFKRAWTEARIWDNSLPVNPPKDLPEEAKQAIIVLARKVLKLESEWS